MEFDIGTAVIAGLAATAVMTVVMYMGFLMGMRMDMPLMLGTMFLPPGPAARLLGLMAHFGMGVVFIIVYAALFDALALESSLAGWGALFGLAHGAIAGMSMGMMGIMHPRLAPTGPGLTGETLPAPGLFGVRMGPMAPVAILALHVLYGAVAGAIYAA